MKKLSLIAILGSTLLISACQSTRQAKYESYFDEIDTNKTGFLSRTELRNHANSKFAKMDSNKDNKVSKEEFVEYKKNKKKKMRSKSSK